MERKFSFTIGEYYHIFNRGIEKKIIFQEDKDWDRFQQLLFLANGSQPVVFKLIRGSPFEQRRGSTLTSIISYSLMSNHFHIVAKEDHEGGISKFMSKLETSYSMYFNTKYERSGGLLCHPFRAKHIDSDEYFRWLISYVHLNPLDTITPGWKASGKVYVRRADTFLRSFTYSSYRDFFVGKRLESAILDIDALPIEITDLENIRNMLKEVRNSEVQGLPLDRQGLSTGGGGVFKKPLYTGK